MANPFDQFATDFQAALPPGAPGAPQPPATMMAAPPPQTADPAGAAMNAPPAMNPPPQQQYGGYGAPPPGAPPAAYGAPPQQMMPPQSAAPPAYGAPPPPAQSVPPGGDPFGGGAYPGQQQPPQQPPPPAPVTPGTPSGVYPGAAPTAAGGPSPDSGSQGTGNPFGGGAPAPVPANTAENLAIPALADPWGGGAPQQQPGAPPPQPPTQPPPPPQQQAYGAPPPDFGGAPVAPPQAAAPDFGAAPPQQPAGAPPDFASAAPVPGAPPPEGAIVPSQYQTNPYAQQVPQQYGQQPPPPGAAYGQQPYGQPGAPAPYGQPPQQAPPQPAAVDPFSVFEAQQQQSQAIVPAGQPAPPPAPTDAMVPAGPGAGPPPPAAAGATDEDFWGSFSANAPAPSPDAAEGSSEGPNKVSEEEKKGDEGLPPGGEWYDARIFTPTLGVMFFKPQELTDSLFLHTDRSIVDTLGDRPVVAFIVEGSSARSAGVELGHVLLKVNGVDVKNPKEASRLIKEGPRPLPLLFYVPNTTIVVAEGEHMVKYDTRETTAPNSAKEWKPKYVVVGGIIAQPWMMNMYRSKSEYDIAVIETQARRPVSVKVKQFSLQGARIQNDWQGPQMVKYKNKLHPWKYVVVLPVARNPIKISSPNLVQLKPVHEGIRRVLLAQQQHRSNPHQAGPSRNSYASYDNRSGGGGGGGGGHSNDQHHSRSQNGYDQGHGGRGESYSQTQQNYAHQQQPSYAQESGYRY